MKVSGECYGLFLDIKTEQLKVLPFPLSKKEWLRKKVVETGHFLVEDITSEEAWDYHKKGYH